MLRRLLKGDGAAARHGDVPGSRVYEYTLCGRVKRSWVPPSSLCFDTWTGGSRFMAGTLRTVYLCNYI
jgi:hypothetical protein